MGLIVHCHVWLPGGYSEVVSQLQDDLLDHLLEEKSIHMIHMSLRFEKSLGPQILNESWVKSTSLVGGFKTWLWFSISYMGCHPKPIDFHSIIFQDGYCITNQFRLVKTESRVLSIHESQLEFRAGVFTCFPCHIHMGLTENRLPQILCLNCIIGYMGSYPLILL